MVKYQIESFTECLEELQDLFEIHYQEIGNDPKNIRLNPDYDTYFHLEDIGQLHLVTVRDDDKIVGYYLSVINPLLHFKHILNAYNDAIFICKDYRKGSIAYKMIRFAIEDLEGLGVNQITLHTKIKQPFDKLCEKLGMTCIERHYTKTLGE